MNLSLGGAFRKGASVSVETIPAPDPGPGGVSARIISGSRTWLRNKPGAGRGMRDLSVIGN